MNDDTTTPSSGKSNSRESEDELASNETRRL